MDGIALLQLTSNPNPGTLGSLTKHGFFVFLVSTGVFLMLYTGMGRHTRMEMQYCFKFFNEYVTTL